MLPVPFTCPDCSKMPARHEPIPADPLPAAVGIIAYLEEKSWSKGDIKALGEYIIKLCDGAAPQRKEPSAHEAILSYFAALLNTDPASLLASRQLDQSFLRTLNGPMGAMDLADKLSTDQVKVISRAILGIPNTTALFADHHHGGDAEIGYQVINKICQSKGSYFTIRELLDVLKPGGT